ncbi:MAG: nickel pincer cofactor biosynthesis protein LarC [Oscillospiraceae bacterium]
MKTLYFDCSMGAAGDMLASALLELCPDRDAALAELNALGIPHVRYVAEESVKCGISGTHLRVLINGEEEDAHAHHGHHGHGLHAIEDIIAALPVSDGVKSAVSAVYALIADAESRVHGVPVSEVHLHEVGALDAVADITACCLLMEKLAPERVTASPVNVGGGTVRCAHGILPVPAPATTLLLLGLPIYSGDIKQELCTPTGAALLRHFADGFGAMPAMTLTALGCGMGSRDYDGAPNCLRALLGESEGAAERVAELSCNLDDMTPEAIGFAMERLLEGGALDVCTIPIGMKKNRPGVQLCCMCRESESEKFRALMFRHTTTLGLRESLTARYTLCRSERTEETSFGPVRVKSAVFEGISREKAEYDDLSRIAREHDLPLAEAARLLK